VDFDPTLGSLSNLAERAQGLDRQKIASDLARMKSRIKSQRQVPSELHDTWVPYNTVRVGGSYCGTPVRAGEHGS
jgi:hypothetical protein